MAQNMNDKPRGFGIRELNGSGHTIEVSGGQTYSTSSMNLRYVLSAFSGFAKSHPDMKMMLNMVDDFGRKKPVARSMNGHTSLLILFR